MNRAPQRPHGRNRLGSRAAAGSAASATSIVKSKSNITNNRTSGDRHENIDGRTVGGGTGAPTAIKRYPPHGYPCLGCHPCPPSFCDNDNNMVVWTDPTGGTLVAWFTAHATA